jgi:preprotein translocase subunit SecE
MSQQSGSEVMRMLLLVAAVVAVVILVFFAIGYGLGRLLL